MRTLLLMVGMLLGFPVWSQPIQRQFFTTNLNPRVIVAAGTNVTVQYTTTGTDIRTYTVNSSGGGATQTNISYTAVTNAPWQWGSQNLTNWSQLSTNLLQDLDQTNWPYTSITNAPWQWGSQNLTNWSQLSTNDLAALTNGYPWTNLTVAIAGAVTNGYPWTNIYSPGISGGSTNQVYTQTGWSGYPQVTNLSLWTNNIGTAIVPSLWLTNPTPAALNAQQYSPALTFGGQGWRSGNSTTMPVQMGMYEIVYQGSSVNPSADFTWYSSVSNSAPSTCLQLSSSGNLTASGAIRSSGSSVSGAAASYLSLYGLSRIYSPADQDFRLTDSTGLLFNRLYFGAANALWPALKIESTNAPTLSIRTGADANYASLVASNVTATATVFANSLTSTNGGTVGGAVLSTSSTTNSPAENELATAGWTRSLFAGAGVSYYATTNVANTFTNSDYAGGTNFEFSTTIPPYGRRLYVDPAVNSYVGSVVVTNKLLQIDANIVVNAYLDCVAGTGSGNLQVHPEIYVSYDGTNWIGDWIAASQTITPGVTNLYQWVVSNPAYVTTNSSGFYVERRFKITAQTSNNNADLGFNLGTNFPSHISLPGQNTSAGMAYLAANQAFTGSNTFSGGMMVWGDANKTNGVWIGPSGEVLSNAVGSVTIAGGNVTGSGVVKATNGLAPGILTVATLPASPVAGQTCWASDVLTTRGVGDLVTWSGSAWLNRENTPATADMYGWILLVKSNSVSPFIYNRVCTILQYSDTETPTYQPAIFTTSAGTSGSSSYSEVSAVGTFTTLSTGTTYDGSERIYTYQRGAPLSSAETNAFGCSAYVGNACSGAEAYWAFVGVDDQTGTNYVGANSGCGFVYDCYQTNITSTISNTYAFSSTWTNNWIAVSAKSGTAVYKDSLLPVSTSSSALNRLLLAYSPSEVVFYTNGIPFWTNSTASSIPTTSPPRHMVCKIVKFIGTTARVLNLKDLMILTRHADRNM